MKFEAKKDTWLSIVIWAAILLPIVLLIMRQNPPILGIVIFMLPSILLTWVWFGTGYEITDEVVKYRFGPFNGEIFIYDIKAVHLTPRESMNAGALSSDRISIIYDKSKTITIAPQEKKKFIEELKKINNNFEIIE